jgi:hypothetical protein
MVVVMRMKMRMKKISIMIGENFVVVVVVDCCISLVY